MNRIVLALMALCASCSAAKSEPMVAAFEVPLPTDSDKEAFLAILREEAGRIGFHVDAVTAEQLRHLSEVSPLTMNATVLRGKDDYEAVASAMDGSDHLGLVWFNFSEGSDPEQAAAFRERTMRRVSTRWPQTMRLPITPSGGIPLREDMVRTATGYEIDPRQMAKYRREAEMR